MDWLYLQGGISIHAPAKGATSGHQEQNPSRVDFNPRSREGSDRHAPNAAVAVAISIHAPAKGATLLMLEGVTPRQDFNPRSREGSDVISHVRKWHNGTISIHAPAKGATCRTDAAAPVLTGFQSTLPRRERPPRAASAKTLLTISIHAPAKGATFDTFYAALHHTHFNPRSREGSDSKNHHDYSQ